METKTMHTLCWNSERCGVDLGDGCGNVIGLFVLLPGETREECEARIRQMLAAPALVEALRDLVAACESLDDVIQGRVQGGEQRRAEAAVAVARAALKEAGL